MSAGKQVILLTDTAELELGDLLGVASAPPIGEDVAIYSVDTSPIVHASATSSEPKLPSRVPNALPNNTPAVEILVKCPPTEFFARFFP